MKLYGVKEEKPRRKALRSSLKSTGIRPWDLIEKLGREIEMKDEPKKKAKPDWRKIKASYLSGSGSLRDTALKFSVSESTLEKRCKREGWKQKREEIGGKVAAKVSEKTAEALALGALAWVNQTLIRANRYRSILDATQDQCGTDREGRPLIDPEELDKMSRVEARVDDIARRAFGLPDTPQKLDVKQSIEIVEVVNPYSEPEPAPPDEQPKENGTS
jgi:hypothetical protein